jgi:hypothetical protein
MRIRTHLSHQCRARKGFLPSLLLRHFHFLWLFFFLFLDLFFAPWGHLRADSALVATIRLDPIIRPATPTPIFKVIPSTHRASKSTVEVKKTAFDSIAWNRLEPSYFLF